MSLQTPKPETTTWEYWVERLPDNDWKRQEAVLNNLGRAGWELTAVLDGVAYLKQQRGNTR